MLRILSILAKKNICEQKNMSTGDMFFYSESNLRFLRDVIAELNAGKGTPHELIEETGMRMKKLWFDKAWEDYLYWQTQDKKVLKRDNQLIRDLERDSFNGIGKPEPLKGELSGFCE